MDNKKQILSDDRILNFVYIYQQNKWIESERQQTSYFNFFKQASLTYWSILIKQNLLNTFFYSIKRIKHGF